MCGRSIMRADRSAPFCDRGAVGRDEILHAHLLAFVGALDPGALARGTSLQAVPPEPLEVLHDRAVGDVALIAPSTRGSFSK